MKFEDEKREENIKKYEEKKTVAKTRKGSGAGAGSAPSYALNAGQLGLNSRATSASFGLQPIHLDKVYTLYYIYYIISTYQVL